ncbi:MAG: DAK2 domain-containing protein [Clostridia bacterium]|nr:DAK2 domain-containing protein [Clostridia bacterium]
MQVLKTFIDGADFRQMLGNAAANVENHKIPLNELNVFPVPDGDTGTNMTMTITAASREVCQMSDARVGKVAEKTASMLLRSARGNSGVILSLLFRGFARGLKDCDKADAVRFAAALKDGVQAAYGAVMRPAEGTILTVSRMAAEEAARAAAETEDVETVLDRTLTAGREALAQTKFQNPVLTKADVVDAGGQGWILVLEGFLAALRGQTIESRGEGEEKSANAFENFETEDINFTYCTEFIVMRAQNSGDPLRLRAYLESIGDCVVVVDDDEIIKVHVHTNNPGLAIEEGLKFGPLTSMKIENMKEQHTEKLSMSEMEPVTEEKIAAPEKRYGFAVVAAGEGVAQLFRDLGADFVVEGGQTMNPSTEDILKAVNATPAEIVIVLPNNKNIIMAAQQVQALTEKQVVVLETKTIPQGVSAMLSFDLEASPEDNAANMTDAFKSVRTAQITYAARDSNFDGLDIHEGDYLALAEGKMCYTGADLSEAMRSVIAYLSAENAEFYTVYRGEDATEDRNAIVEEMLAAALPEAEVNVLDGGQPVYYYMISAE